VRYAWLIPPVKSPPAKKTTSVEDARPPPGTLWRHEVDAVVDGGMGPFLKFLLGRMRWEALADERAAFVGWEVLSLARDDFWTGVDLRAGDVITAVNGKPIERETQAFDAFTSLKKADELVLSLLRQDERMELVWKITEQPGRQQQAAPAHPDAPTDSKPGESAEWPSVDKPMPGTGDRPKGKPKQ